jgi:hypothetical protein
MKLVLRQLLRLPYTLVAVHRIVREDCSIASADEHLWAFRGFHLESWDSHYRARCWQKASIADISRGDVAGMSADELAFMMRVAMEIEDPIVEYSQQNGEGFRLLLPALGRFMGRNDAEAAHAREQGLPWCESPWCAEERRHGNLFAKLVERLTTVAPPRDNPNQPRAMTANEEAALGHLVSRESAEWASSSTYVVMAAHASGNLHAMARNVARDEIKHLCILSAADAYLLGPRPWRRLRELIGIGLENYRGQRRSRSQGGRIGSNPITALEVVAAHLMMEYRVRKWLASVPLGALAAVFETPSMLPEAAAGVASADEQARIDETFARGRARRLDLARWQANVRRAALERQQFETTHAAELARIAGDDLGGFEGAAVPGSPGAKALRRRIARRSPRAFRASLDGQLRAYQIRNNRHVLAREKARSNE